MKHCSAASRMRARWRAAWLLGGGPMATALLGLA
jgi:hypothetical protein